MKGMNINNNVHYACQKMSSIPSRKARKITLIIIIIGILIILFFIQKVFLNSPRKQIIGIWKTEEGFTYVFNADKTYFHDGGQSGTYSINKNQLILCPTLEDLEIYKIEISSKSLNIYKDGELYRELKKMDLE